MGLRLCAHRAIESAHALCTAALCHCRLAHARGTCAVRTRRLTFYTPSPRGARTDYYQDANLTFGATDQLIDTINAHAVEWGVHARYATSSQYVDAVLSAAKPPPMGLQGAEAPLPRRRTASAVGGVAASTAAVGKAAVGAATVVSSAPAVRFPVVGVNTSFFTYQDWCVASAAALGQARAPATPCTACDS